MSGTGPRRLPTGGRIARSRSADFFFDGQRVQAFEGDSVASALLAGGHRVVARSFKYHRPRGIVGAGVEECNALMGVGVGAQHEPNLPATLVPAQPGLQVFSQNAWPSVQWDCRAVNGWFAPLLGAGFYYKTFMGPFKGTRAWMFFEEHIRRAAGIGKVDISPDEQRYDAQHDFIDLLIVGSGPAGLSAALAAAESGLDVMLVEQDADLGGSLLGHAEDSSWGRWLAACLTRLQATPRVQLLTRSTAFGLYDSHTMGVVQQAAPDRHDPAFGEPKQRLRTVRFGAVVMACGAIERPLVFAGNDCPGVMLASAVGQYLHRHAVQCGQNALFAVNNDAAYGPAIALAQSGAQVTLADSRREVDPTLLHAAKAAGVAVRQGCTVVQARGASGWPDGGGRGGDREVGRERRARAEHRGEFHRAAGLGHDPVGGGQPETGAVPARPGGEERFERPPERVGIHPDACVGHPDRHVAAGGERQGALGQRDVGGLDRQPSAVGHGVATVDRHVHQHLVELAGVGLDRPQPAGEVELQLDVVAERPTEHGADRLDDRVEIQPLGPGDVSSGEGEQLPGECGGGLGGLFDVGEIGGCGRDGRVGTRLHRFPGERRVVGDHGEQVVEVVGDATRELSEALEPLGL